MRLSADAIVMCWGTCNGVPLTGDGHGVFLLDVGDILVNEMLNEMLQDCAQTCLRMCIVDSRNCMAMGDECSV